MEVEKWIVHPEVAVDGLLQYAEPVLEDQVWSVTPLSVQHSCDRWMMLMIVEPCTLVDILASDKRGLCDARIGDPSLHLARVSSRRSAPIDVASDVGEDEFGSEKFIVELGILPVMVLETNQTFGIFEYIASGFDETLFVEMDSLEFICSRDTCARKWNSRIAILSQDTPWSFVCVLVLILVHQPILTINLSRKQKHFFRKVADALQVNRPFGLFVEKLGIFAKLEVFLWADVKEGRRSLIETLNDETILFQLVDCSLSTIPSLLRLVTIVKLEKWLVTDQEQRSQLCLPRTTEGRELVPSWPLSRPSTAEMLPRWKTVVISLLV